MMTDKEMRKSILLRTRKLRLKFIAEFNRGAPWVSVHERGLGMDKGNVFFCQGDDAAILIDEADGMSEKFNVSEGAAFLFMLDSAGAFYR